MNSQDYFNLFLIGLIVGLFLGMGLLAADIWL